MGVLNRMLVIRKGNDPCKPLAYSLAYKRGLIDVEEYNHSTAFQIVWLT